MEDTRTPYTCEVCNLSWPSAKELVRHYKEEHPNSVEAVTIPI